MIDSRILKNFLVPLTAAAVLTLGACSNDNDTATTAPATTTVVTTEAPAATTSAAESTTTASAPATTKGGSLKHALAAIETVKDKGDVVELDFDDTEWKLDVAKNNAPRSSFLSMVRR